MRPEEQNVRGKIIILSFYVFYRKMCIVVKKKEKSKCEYHVYLRNSNPT